jgi:hypothetical protein
MSIHATVHESARRIPISIGGLATVFGGLLLVAASSLEAVAGMARPGTPGFVATLGLLLLSSAFLAMGAFSASSYLYRQANEWAAYGLLTAAFAHVVLAIGSALPLVTQETSAWTTPSGYVRLAGVLIAVCGVTLLSAALWRAATIRTAAVTWLWALPILALFVAVGGHVQNAIGIDLLWILLGVQLGAGWLILGYRLWLAGRGRHVEPAAPDLP